jgi:hypothetical protein
VSAFWANPECPLLAVSSLSKLVDHSTTGHSSAALAFANRPVHATRRTIPFLLPRRCCESRLRCPGDVPSPLSSTSVWNPIPHLKEIGSEEAFFQKQIIGFMRDAQGSHLA